MSDNQRDGEKAEIPESLPDELAASAAITAQSAGAELDTSADFELSDGDSLTLVNDDTPDFDKHYLRLFETGVADKGSEKLLVSFSESGVPEMVHERIREAIMGGALFSDFESIPSSRLMDLRTEFADMLTEDGWTTDSLVDQLQEFDPELSDARAENIARSETAEIVNTAREDAYLERDLGDDLFKWTGTDEDGTSDNHRTTRACGWLKEQTNPEFGGTPRPLDELKELIGEAWKHDPDMDQDLSRGWTAHPQERHTFTRHIA